MLVKLCELKRIHSGVNPAEHIFIVVKRLQNIGVHTKFKIYPVTLSVLPQTFMASSSEFLRLLFRFIALKH